MKRNNFFTRLVLLIIPILTTLMIEIIHRGSFNEFLDWISSNGYLFFYTVLIVFAIPNSLAILIRSKKAMLIFNLTISFILLILAYISNLKIDLRGEPLSILDYQLITEALGVIKGFELNLWLPIILILLFILSITIILLKVRDKMKLSDSLVCSSLSIVILIFILNLEIEDFGEFNISVPADISFNHEANGFVLASVIDSKFLTVPEPENYSKQKIIDIVEDMENYRVNTVSVTEFEKPNIIFIMSESFSNPSQLMKIKTNKEVIPNFKKYAVEHASGTISVPGIGGGTANTEFEVLTGFSKDNIPNYSAPYNPYNTYITDNIDSLASEFAQQSYETLAIHTYHSWFYRRNLVYKNLGFKQFLPLEFLDNDKYAGQFLDDQVINDVIIERVNQTKNRDFIYAVTMASHGPYDVEMPKDIILEENVANRNEVENYLNAIHISDQRLGELIRYFEKHQEPTLIIFFGDHIPPLGNDFYNSIGVEMGSKVSKEAPLLIWSNYKANEPSTVALEADLLGAFVLKEIGYHKNAYFNYLSQRLEAEEMEDNFKNNIYNYQYDVLHGKRYIDSIKPSYQNEEFILGYDFKIDQIAAKKYKEFTVLQISGAQFPRKLWLNVHKQNYPVYLETPEKGYVYIPNKVLEDTEQVSLIVKDSRETIVKESNPYTSNEIVYLNSDINFENWYSADLNGDQYWEVFDVKNDYIIVRLQLSEHPLMENRPYYIIKDGEILQDKNADLIDTALYSDIYPNGYLYISIPRNEELGGEVEDIKHYFSEGNYTLYTLD